MYINLNGGDFESSGAGVLYAQVRTMNAAETDFTNGSEQTIYSTGNGVRSFDICSIGTDKFLVIYQEDTAGSGAGISVVVLTVSGTTITVGTPVTIETLGGVDKMVSCSKVDTDKGIIFYKDDSGDDLTCQVLTVSGTTITTNTPVTVKSAANSRLRVKSIQLQTNSILCVYQDDNSSYLFARVISVSGTTPSLGGSEQTLISTTANHYIGLCFISSTKALLAYSESTTPTTDKVAILTISGNTVTKGSNLSLGSERRTYEFGMVSIGIKYAMVVVYASNTQFTNYFLDISGSTPTSISSQNLSCSDLSSIHVSASIVKVSPWIYMVIGGGQSNADYIVKLTISSSNVVGIALSAIANAATGQISHRFKTHTLTGLTLTPGSKYYVDDTGQPTTGSSSVSPALGIAVNTTDLLVL
jgi:hypothetical protein